MPYFEVNYRVIYDISETIEAEDRFDAIEQVANRGPDSHDIAMASAPEIQVESVIELEEKRDGGQACIH